MKGTIMRIHLWDIAMFFCLFSAVAQGQDRPIVLKASTLLDGKGGVIKDTAIVIQGGKISKLDPNAQGTVYDLRGLTVMPGWINTHLHIGAHFDPDGRSHTNRQESPEQSMLYMVENAYNLLMAGFTTVQSVGEQRDKDLRDAIARGTIPGPRVLTSLRPVNERTGSPEQIREFVRKVVADGADLVKIFATNSIRDGGAQTMTDEQIQAACSEATQLGKRTLVHAQGPEGAKASVLAGCTSIEHGNRLTDEVINLMAQRGTYFDPNFGLLLHNYIENKAKFLGIGNYDEQGFAYMEKGIPIGIDTFKRALAKNLKIVFGTDSVAGALGRDYEEFIYRVRDGGQKPMDALVAAQSRAAESIRMQTQIGSIAPGMEADIIAVQGNPLEDITAVRRAVFVMKGGKVYKNVSPANSSNQWDSGPCSIGCPGG
jgi:imidazolonepropionase-like amidohydrolase